MAEVAEGEKVKLEDEKGGKRKEEYGMQTAITEIEDVCKEKEICIIQSLHWVSSRAGSI